MAADRLAVARLDRADFLARYWRYRKGEHVTVLGPTGSGKTYLCNQLLMRSATPTVPAVILVMKPRDATVRTWAREAGFRLVQTWPPPPWMKGKYPGFVLWPRTRFDPRLDRPEHARIFRRAILDSYAKGDRILFADELFGLTNRLDLEDELVDIWVQGRSMGCGLWGASQKPTHIPTWAYSQAQHLFLAKDPDKRGRDRYSEISGVDADLVKHVVANDLARHEWLYVRAEDAVMCIIGR